MVSFMAVTAYKVIFGIVPGDGIKAEIVVSGPGALALSVGEAAAELASVLAAVLAAVSAAVLAAVSAAVLAAVSVLAAAVSVAAILLDSCLLTGEPATSKPPKVEINPMKVTNFTILLLEAGSLREEGVEQHSPFEMEI
jgi:hypothetical protein